MKEALKGDDIERIRSATDTLMQAFQKVGQAVYQQQQAAGGAEGAAASGDAAGTQAGGDDVVEGEVVDEGGA